MAYRTILSVQVHARDQVLFARLNGIAEPLAVALDRGMQRRVCNPAFQGSWLTVGGCRYDARLDSKVSEADERGEREDDTENETCNRSHLHSSSAQTRFWSG